MINPQLNLTIPTALKIDSFRLRFPSIDDDLLPSNHHNILTTTPPQENVFRRTRYGRVIRPPVKLDLNYLDYFIAQLFKSFDIGSSTSAIEPVPIL